MSYKYQSLPTGSDTVAHSSMAPHPDSDGLQHVPDSDGLQYVPPPQHNDKFVTDSRRASFESPEVNRHNDDNFLKQTLHQPEQAYDGPRPHGKSEASDHEPQRQSRICGVSPRLFTILTVLVALVIVGAVLGGVLGTVLPSRKHKDNAIVTGTNATTGTNETTSFSSNGTFINKGSIPRPLNLSKVAAMDDLLSSILLYYQISNGSVVELTFPIADLNGTTTLSNRTDYNWTVIADGADLQSPLSPIPWNDTASSLATRQVFFAKDGYVSQIKRSSVDGIWSSPVNITSDRLAINTSAICAITEPFTLQDYRVYYGTAQGGVQEIAYSLSTNSWSTYHRFYRGDPGTGLGCRIQSNPINTWMSIFYRDGINGTLQRYSMEYSSPNENSEWIPGPSTSPTIVEGSSITVSWDGNETYFILFQSDQGVEWGMVDSYDAGDDWTVFNARTALDNSTSLASWYSTDVGPVAFIPSASEEVVALNYHYNGVLYNVLSVIS